MTDEERLEQSARNEQADAINDYYDNECCPVCGGDTTLVFDFVQLTVVCRRCGWGGDISELDEGEAVNDFEETPWP